MEFLVYILKCLGGRYGVVFVRVFLSAELVVQEDCLQQLQALPRLSDVYFDMLLVNTAIMTFYAGNRHVNKPLILYRQLSGIC